MVDVKRQPRGRGTHNPNFQMRNSCKVSLKTSSNIQMYLTYPSSEMNKIIYLAYKVK